MYQENLSENLLKLLAISCFIEAAVLTIGAVLYWSAYNKMKKTPIIGWISASLGTGALVSIMAGLSLLFRINLFISLLIMSRLLVTFSILMFIKASLSPNTEKKIKIIEKVIKKIN